MRAILTILVAMLSIGAMAQDQLPPITDSASSNVTIDLMVRERLQRYEDSIADATLKLQIASTAQADLRRRLEAELAGKRTADSLKYAKLMAQIATARKGAVGYPVVVAQDTVRWIYTKFGVLSAAERAEHSTEKIKQVASIFVPSIDSISMRNEEMNIEIYFGDHIITTITQADALWFDMDQTVMATQIAEVVQHVITEHRKQTSIITIAKQVGLSILIIAMCVVLVRFIQHVFRRRLRRFLLSKVGVWFNGWKIRDYTIMNAKRQVRMVLFTVKIARWTLSLFMLYIVLPILFSLFPMTQRLADTLFDWVFDPVKKIFWAIVDYLPNLFVIVVIWFVMRYIIRGVKYLMNEIAVGNLKVNGFYSDWAPATYNILRVVFYAFGFVMMFPYLPGSDSPVFKGVSVFLGVIFSLGSSTLISNLIAGLVITYMRPFKIGDHIKIGETTGDVLEKTPFVTRVKTHKQEIVTIPNSNILSASVVNYSTSAADKGVIFHTTITIGYDVPWPKVHSMMIEAALRCEYVLRDPAPFVLQTSLDDFYVSYQLCVYTHNPEYQATIYSQMHLNIQDVFNENDIEIMSPHYRAGRDGSESTVPEKYCALK